MKTLSKWQILVNRKLPEQEKFMIGDRINIECYRKQLGGALMLPINLFPIL